MHILSSEFCEFLSFSFIGFNFIQIGFERNIDIVCKAKACWPNVVCGNQSTEAVLCIKPSTFFYYHRRLEVSLAFTQITSLNWENLNLKFPSINYETETETSIPSHLQLWNCCRLNGKCWGSSATVNFAQEWSQNTNIIQSEHTKQYSKHRKNCECCPVSLLIVR